MGVEILDVLLDALSDFHRARTLSAATNLEGLARMFYERLKDAFADQPYGRSDEGLDSANKELLGIAADWRDRSGESEAQ